MDSIQKGGRGGGNVFQVRFRKPFRNIIGMLHKHYEKKMDTKYRLQDKSTRRLTDIFNGIKTV